MQSRSTLSVTSRTISFIESLPDAGNDALRHLALILLAGHGRCGGTARIVARMQHEQEVLLRPEPSGRSVEIDLCLLAEGGGNRAGELAHRALLHQPHAQDGRVDPALADKTLELLTYGILLEAELDKIHECPVRGDDFQIGMGHHHGRGETGEKRLEQLARRRRFSIGLLDPKDQAEVSRRSGRPRPEIAALPHCEDAQ